MDYPGMTKYLETSLIKPYTGMFVTDRKIVFLASSGISTDTLFNNGLFQNIYIFYRMFEAMGWFPIMFINKTPENMESIPLYMRNIAMLNVADFAQHAIKVDLYIEIGMSLDQVMRGYLKSCGAKICKLYLGNILNIDIETPVIYPSMYFAHHVVGDLDAIWTSPHYYQHHEYARALNNIDIEKKESVIVPYVWDPQILLGGGERNFTWTAPTKDKEVFLILEPNISFQKCALIPLMIMEAWFRKNPTWDGEVVIINGERIMMIPFFKESIWNNLDIVKAGRVKIKGRMDILSILREFPSGIPICHQWNNEYNYMVLEFFWTGFPVLHNATDWKNFGYYYDASNINMAVGLIDKIRLEHSKLFSIYMSHAKTLAWRYSPYNPDVHAKWNSILKELGCG